MNGKDMVALARRIAEGGTFKKSEVVAFMTAFLGMDPDLQAGGPGMTKEETFKLLPVLPFEIEKTGSGIHVPREANRAYTKAEGAALVAAIAKALEIT